MNASDTPQGNLPSTRRSLPMSLIRAREQVMVPIRQMLAESGLTEQQWRVLRVLSESGALEATILSQRAALLLPSQTRIVQSMEEKGLVKRRPHDTDRRRHTIEITDAGQAIINENLGTAKDIAAGFVAHLGREKYDQLLDLLEELQQLNVDSKG